ncbi:MAG TPA: ATP-binding protein [Gaiellaceae bacterium]|nr:ATP-binding protein [Gaiellaceae bacterium]
MRERQKPKARREGFAKWMGIAGSARTRILASYVILLTLSAILSTLAIREILLLRLDDRIQDAGQQEVAELERLLTIGVDPESDTPFTDPARLFEVYMARNVPSSEEALFTFADGRLQDRALQRFPLTDVPNEVLADWAALSTDLPGKGERVTGTFDTELGKAHYRVRRVVLPGGEGAFVVATLPAKEYEEIEDVQTYGFAVTLIVLILASAAAWLIAGRALAPVRELTQTARSISQSDLTRRIEAQGAGDAAEMARSFNAMLDRLERVFRGQREFVQDASHELRDPLTICRGHLELLSDDPAERQATVTLVIDELDRMSRMVDDLQLLAESEHPDFVQRSALDLALIAHELVAKASALGPRHWVLDHAAGGTVLADRHRLTEAVMNLAHNAVQHTTADDTIAIGTALTNEEALIWVRDTGTGVPLSEQDRIFDRFTRGREASRRYRGGGLGLANVKAIAEAHGGRVELESRLNEGATFTIILPRYPVDTQPDVQDPDR